MEKQSYSIGEEEPWRLTKESGYNLILAICKTGAEITNSNLDSYLPGTYAMIRFKIEEDKEPEFKKYFPYSFRILEQVSGQ